MTYTTVQGDMWDSIAYKIFGNVAATDQLMALNQQYLHTYIFPAGVVLTLPKPKRKASSRPEWCRGRRWTHERFSPPQ